MCIVTSRERDLSGTLDWRREEEHNNVVEAVCTGSSRICLLWHELFLLKLGVLITFTDEKIYIEVWINAGKQLQAFQHFEKHHHKIRVPPSSSFLTAMQLFPNISLGRQLCTVSNFTKIKTNTTNKSPPLFPQPLCFTLCWHSISI